MAHPCAAPPFARIPAGYPGRLTLLGAANCLRQIAPACSLTIVLAVKGSLLTNAGQLSVFRPQ
ncbi:hypothetical protein HA45_04390 [Pantoea rodasii]|nr:hypothetical protein HA45_04390 [Pantoea rodasii]